MIGNDIVDLNLARKQSNWKRKGYLNKIFSSQEQTLIHNDSNPELMVWNLWSRKEAVYKIYNRQTGNSGFFPLKLECFFDDKNSGTVRIDNFVFYTQTQIEDDFVYTVAVSEFTLFDKIKSLETTENIEKDNGIPFYVGSESQKKQPVSITHHGLFQKIITLQ
jgi:phosphopantetheinyl transferase (holo-ACP synthase)